MEIDVNRGRLPLIRSKNVATGALVLASHIGNTIRGGFDPSYSSDLLRDILPRNPVAGLKNISLRVACSQAFIIPSATSRYPPSLIPHPLKRKFLPLAMDKIVVPK